MSTFPPRFSQFLPCGVDVVLSETVDSLGRTGVLNVLPSRTGLGGDCGFEWVSGASCGRPCETSTTPQKKELGVTRPIAAPNIHQQTNAGGMATCSLRSRHAAPAAWDSISGCHPGRMRMWYGIQSGLGNLSPPPIADPRILPSRSTKSRALSLYDPNTGTDPFIAVIRSPMRSRM